MKFLINSLRLSYYASIGFCGIFTYAVFTHGIEWVLFLALSCCLTLVLRRDLLEMEADIKEHLAAVSYAVYVYCNCEVEQSGKYSLQTVHNNITYYIDLKCEINGYEDEGAEFMGDRERLYVETGRDITIIDMESQNEYGEEYDCGFTAKDLQKHIL